MPAKNLDLQFQFYIHIIFRGIRMETILIGYIFDYNKDSYEMIYLNSDLTIIMIKTNQV